MPIFIERRGLGANTSLARRLASGPLRVRVRQRRVVNLDLRRGRRHARACMVAGREVVRAAGCGDPRTGVAAEASDRSGRSARRSFGGSRWVGAGPEERREEAQA